MAMRKFTLSVGVWTLSVFILLLQPGCVTAMERRQVTYDSVREVARDLAASEYAPEQAYLPDAFRQMDYDAYRHIRFRPDQALWLSEELPFQVQLFHRGYLYQDPVFIHEFTDSHVQELPYVRDFFRFENLEIDQSPKRGSGYAGWRLHAPLNADHYFDEVIAFLGASYFRAVGANQSYGISARGLLLPHADGEPEEFPAFVRFWLQKPSPDSRTLTALALLDSPSLAGAYQFRITPGKTTRVDVLVSLYPRKPVQEIGLAALTSMFYFGENTHPRPDDFRPEVHDSDGLSLEYADRQYHWRPLNAPARERVSRFDATHLVAFGLYQRDRDFRHFLDEESRYERRPSVNVRLGTGFSGGQVLLRELPPDKEFSDNIVAAYVPGDSLEPGKSYQFDFSMSWGSFPVPTGISEVLQTRHGSDLHRPDMEVFLVEFSLPEALLSAELEPDAFVSSNAEIGRIHLNIDREAGTVRAHLNVIPTADGDVRLSLRLLNAGKSVSEKWVYVWSRYN